MSFEFDNSKNKNHLLQSLLQEIKHNKKVLKTYAMNTTIYKSFVSTNLIFNFDLDTQFLLSQVYENVEVYNKINYEGKDMNSDILSNFNETFPKKLDSLIERLESIITTT